MSAHEKTQEYQRLDAAHYLHPFTDARALAGKARVIARAEGVYLWDSDGNKLLDAMSGLWCVNAGYGREEIAEAVAEQLARLPYYNSFFQCATPPAIELAAELARVSPPGFNRAFFTTSGSEAIDTVVRVIRRYWQLRGEPKRVNIIARENAYHGSTVAGMSLGGMAIMHEQGGPPMPGVARIRQPKWFGEGDAEAQTPEEFGAIAARALAEKIDELGAETVAAFIGEPVQGAGGVVVPPPNYWNAVQQICDEHSVPIVADEVICAFGRTGAWFGSETFGIRPKLMPVAKALTSGYLPMGGVLLHDDIADVLAEGGEFAHGYTYSGHPVCAAAALANLKILREEKLIERARDDIGPYLQKQWQTLADHPLVGETRGVGMLAALEIAQKNNNGNSKNDNDKNNNKNNRRFQCDPPAGIQCRELCAANGLVMRAVGDTMIIAPPLTITRAEVDELINKARQSLNDLASRL